MTVEPASDGTLAAGAIDPTELLEYQPDAIVSRTIVARDETTVTLFAVAEGQSISEHSAPHLAMIYLLEGRAAITIDGEETTVSAGEMLMLPPDVPHALVAPEPFKMFLTMAR